MNSLDLGGKGENPVRKFIGYDDEYVNPEPNRLVSGKSVKDLYDYAEETYSKSDDGGIKTIDGISGIAGDISLENNIWVKQNRDNIKKFNFLRTIGTEASGVEYTATEDFFLYAKSIFGGGELECGIYINGNYEPDQAVMNNYTGEDTPPSSCFYILKGEKYIIKYGPDTTYRGTYHVKNLISTNVMEGETVYLFDPSNNNISQGSQVVGSDCIPNNYTEVPLSKPIKNKVQVWTGSAWEYRNNLYPNHLEYCKWVEDTGYTLDESKKSKLIQVISNNKKSNADIEIEKAMWERDNADFQKAREEIVHVVKQEILELNTKPMEELIGILNN